MSRERDYSHMTGDSRKRIIEADLLNHDELHAHLDVDFTGPNIELGED